MPFLLFGIGNRIEKEANTKLNGVFNALIIKKSSLHLKYLIAFFSAFLQEPLHLFARMGNFSNDQLLLCFVGRGIMCMLRISNIGRIPAIYLLRNNSC